MENKLDSLIVVSYILGYIVFVSLVYWLVN